jgi:cytoskeletal protein CcmA (bactofilin family)
MLASDASRLSNERFTATFYHKCTATARHVVRVVRTGGILVQIGKRCGAGASRGAPAAARADRSLRQQVLSRRTVAVTRSTCIMSESRLRRLRDRSSGPATLVSEGCKINGIVTGGGNFHLAGEVDGDCDFDGTVTLARSGSWKGTIRAANVIIAGRVEGDIVAGGRVEITNSARISGTVSGEAIAVAEGAVVEGVMRTTGPVKPTEFVEKRTEA